MLELYRCRWQVELAFKRLKSILATGHLKKTDPIGAKAWLQGKLLAAVIIEALINLGERFSPGDTHCSTSRPRCLWRETSLMRFLLSGAVNPKLLLRHCLPRWRLISHNLREPIRRRTLQMDLSFANTTLKLALMPGPGEMAPLQTRSFDSSRLASSSFSFFSAYLRRRSFSSFVSSRMRSIRCSPLTSPNHETRSACASWAKTIQ